MRNLSRWKRLERDARRQLELLLYARVRLDHRVQEERVMWARRAYEKDPAAIVNERTVRRLELRRQELHQAVGDATRALDLVRHEIADAQDARLLSRLEHMKPRLAQLEQRNLQRLAEAELEAEMSHWKS